MAPTMVTVGTDGIDGGEVGPRPPTGRGPVFVVIGLVAGLVLGILFTGSDPPPSSPTGTTAGTLIDSPGAAPTTTRPPSTTTTDVVVPRLATMVPGMLDTLVVSGVDRNGMSSVTVWRPADRIPTVENLPWGRAATDASRTWLASFGVNRWVGGMTLWVGNAAYMEPVSTSLVSGPVWHARLPGRLAWVEDTGDGPTLVRAELIAGQTMDRVAVGPLPSGGLVAWTDAGYLVGTTDEVLLLDDTGSVVAAVPGISIGTGQSLVAITGARPAQALVTSALEEVGPVPWEADCHRVVWSPGGVAALVWCGFGSVQRVEYWGDPVTHDTPLYVHEGADYVDVGFTSNGIPYLAHIDPIRPSSEIVFYHPADGSTHPVAYPGRIQHLVSVAS